VNRHLRSMHKKGGLEQRQPESKKPSAEKRHDEGSSEDGEYELEELEFDGVQRHDDYKNDEGEYVQRHDVHQNDAMGRHSRMSDSDYQLSNVLYNHQEQSSSWESSPSDSVVSEPRITTPKWCTEKHLVSKRLQTYIHFKNEANDHPPKVITDYLETPKIYMDLSNPEPRLTTNTPMAGLNSFFDPDQPLMETIPHPPLNTGYWEMFNIPGPLEPWIVPPPSPRHRWPEGLQGGRTVAVHLYFRNGWPHHTRILSRLASGEFRWWLLDEEEMKDWGLHIEELPPVPVE
jgi:hypothetical protein